jgi:hypothetical protein
MIIITVVIIIINTQILNSPSFGEAVKNTMNYNQRLRNFRTAWHVPSTAALWILLGMRSFKIQKFNQNLMLGLRRLIIFLQDYWYYCLAFRLPLLFNFVC